MESLNNVVEQAKELVGQYTGSTSTQSASSSTDAQPGSSGAPPVLEDAPDAVDGIGPTGGAALIEHEGVANADAPNVDQGAEYSATGRDATGTFDGGANDPPNLGAGVMPGRAT
ncbi:hypothetical protein BMF94_4810 [Rhodotorula taiwanensis]|uniref:Uncharacterized protein n=1 Tax=Rhodotorula taiwanensis TaxID=741276 RepID=A0A2S5B5V4_9BASI|nr:hypothetical protein BMF94_4810 [Rhodotorula taiwanensis]